MENLCKYCVNYKLKNAMVGFCKKNTTLVKGYSKKDCFEVVAEPIVENFINNYEKIIIRDGKKIYIKG